MPEKDWDLGQSLIEKGFCTLDQIREALSIQDRMKAMGVVPKSLPEVLLEKGYINSEQLRQVGIKVSSAPQISKAPRPAAARTTAPRRNLAPHFALVAIIAILSAFFYFGGDILKVFSSQRPERAEKRPVEPSGPNEAEKADVAAREALDRVTAFQQTSNDFEN